MNKETDEDRVNYIKSSFENLAFNGIISASAGGSKLGAFILGSCFVDCMAGFACGRHANKEAHLTFVRDYFPAYDPEKLYRDLRCGLVHNYSEGGSYVLTYASPWHHGKKVQGGRTVINLENFIADIRSAMHKLLDEIQTDEKKREKGSESTQEGQAHGCGSPCATDTEEEA